MKDVPTLIKSTPPISDEKLQELDIWYEQFTSNSWEMKFCDADYWAMRKRLLMVEEELAALKKTSSDQL